jgi:hypothetical protein
MELEKQVCSLDLAKRLKELGVKQESVFWWEQVKIAGRNEWKKNWTLGFNNNSPHYRGGRTIAAFTVAEVAHILAPHASKMDRLGEEQAYKIPEPPNEFVLCMTSAEFWGDVLAQLLENKLITI